MNDTDIAALIAGEEQRERDGQNWDFITLTHANMPGSGSTNPSKSPRYKAISAGKMVNRHCIFMDRSPAVTMHLSAATSKNSKSVSPANCIFIRYSTTHLPGRSTKRLAPTCSTFRLSSVGVISRRRLAKGRPRSLRTRVWPLRQATSPAAGVRCCRARRLAF